MTDPTLCPENVPNRKPAELRPRGFRPFDAGAGGPVPPYGNACHPAISGAYNPLVARALTFVPGASMMALMAPAAI